MVWTRLAGGLYIKISNNLSKPYPHSWSWKVEWSLLLSCTFHWRRISEALDVMQGAGITVNLYCKLGLGDIETACKGPLVCPRKFCFLSFTHTVLSRSTAHIHKPDPLSSLLILPERFISPLWSFFIWIYLLVQTVTRRPIFFWMRLNLPSLFPVCLKTSERFQLGGNSVIANVCAWLSGWMCSGCFWGVCCSPCLYGPSAA